MISQLVGIVAAEFSGERARQVVAGICQFHRIQASPGYREAAEYIARHLRTYGVQHEIKRFPADGRKYYWTYRSFPAWTPESAHLDLIQPEQRRLADFSEVKTSLLQRSAGLQRVEAELVGLEDGTNPEDYEGLRVRGKLVLSRGDPQRVLELAVGRHRALGLVSDRIWEVKPVRGRYDLPGACQYMGVLGDTDDLKTFAFVIPVREGERLRQLVREENRKGRKVLVRAEIKARLHAGFFDVVDAWIPGQTEEEVLLVAHLCHPQPSANDNASGSACLLEVARTVVTLLRNRRLDRLQRGIRFLWVPEFSGTYAYLATYPRTMKRTIAGLNLDMVGQNQELCGGSMLIENPPWAMPSYAAELLRRIRDEIVPEARSYGGHGGFALFRYADVPFSGGSDHAVLSDPMVGIPCPMISQWPDRYYHTSEDTLDKVDAASLRRVGTIAATYACFLASSNRHKVRWLGEEVVSQAQIELLRTCRKWISRLTEDPGVDIPAICRYEDQLEVWLEQKLKALDSLNRLARIPEELKRLKDELRTAFDRELAKFAIACPHDRSDYNITGPRNREERVAARIVPKRLFPGPVQLRGLLQELSAQERERWYQFSKRHESGLGTRADLAMFWADGKRDLLRIADLVEAESGHRDVAALVGYFRLLERLRLVRLETRRGRSGKNRMSEQAQTRRSRVRVRSRPST